MKGAFAFAAAVGVVNAGAYHNTTQELTTSTIYTTSVHTVSKCPETVTDCPYGHLTTETIAISTTVCPVSKTTEVPTSWTTSTIYTTSVHTVTKCPPEVIDCPVGPHVTTETIAISTTVCPVTEEHPAPPTYTAPPTNLTTSTLYTTQHYTITKCPPEVPNCPIGSVTTTVYPTGTTICPVTYTTVVTPGTTKVIPQPPPVSKPSQPPASQPPYSKPSQPPAPPATTTAVVVTPTGTEPAQVSAAAGRVGFEMVAAAAGVAAFFL
ncbi:Fc.00g115110.m01.CDS01 [Cosmosporella sp. VM-42]